MRESVRCVLLSLVLGLGGAHSVFASDGVLEISQACAIGGCFSGDAPGFPVTIDGTAGASYVLTSGLVVAGANTTAIEVTGNGISIDLNGFAVRGTTTCNFAPHATCAPIGNGHGITGSANVQVRNGTVIGLGGYGLDLGFDSVVEDLRVLNCGLGGIRLGPGGAVRSTTANGNGGSGVTIDFRGGVYSAIATNNNVDGIRMGDGSLVRDSVAHSNGGDGIECTADCLAIANEVTSNVGVGLRGPGDCFFNLAYGANMISRNAGGIAADCVVQVGANVCNGSAAACP